MDCCTELNKKGTNKEPVVIEKKIPGGKYIKISISISDGIIDDLAITGDFFIYPEEFIDSLETIIIGEISVPYDISLKMKDYYDNYDGPVEFIGISFDDIMNLTMECMEKASQSS